MAKFAKLGLLWNFLLICGSEFVHHNRNHETFFPTEAEFHFSVALFPVLQERRLKFYILK